MSLSRYPVNRVEIVVIRASNDISASQRGSQSADIICCSGIDFDRKWVERQHCAVFSEKHYVTQQPPRGRQLGLQS
jgi:hypothetical protein